jgi:hypothetical protein
MPRASEVEQLRHAEHVGRVHHRRVNHHVVVDELCRPRRICKNAADPTRHQEDVLGAIGAEPVIDRRLIAKIELIASRGEQIAIPVLAETPDDSRTDEASVTGDKDA